MPDVVVYISEIVLTGVSSYFIVPIATQCLNKGEWFAIYTQNLFALDVLPLSTSIPKHSYFLLNVSHFQLVITVTWFISSHAADTSELPCKTSYFQYVSLIQ